MDRLESLYPKSIDLKTSRILDLLALLKNPQNSIPPVIHIAGTNGKGSTAAYMRAGLSSKSSLVHSYTSPHLIDFKERIRISSKLISENLFAKLLIECENINNGQPITLFEIVTSIAFLAFSKNKAAWTILEVGLGGRLDATNVITKPHLTVITPISLDHQEFLGKNLESIAYEKAGILKPNVVAVIGKQQPEAMTIIKSRAKEINSPLLIYDEDYKIKSTFETILFEDNFGTIELPKPSLHGHHQVENAATAIAGLRHLGCSKLGLKKAMTKVKWPGRLQQLRSGSLYEIAEKTNSELWVDGGHNAAAGQALSKVFSGKNKLPLYLIFGMLKTKDCRSFIEPFANQIKKVVVVEITNSNLSTTKDHLLNTATNLNIECVAAESIGSAILKINQDNLHSSSRILICGSLYLAGDALRQSGFLIE